MPTQLLGLQPNHWNKYTASYHRLFINMRVSTLKGRGLLKKIRYVYAKSQYFIVTVIPHEMQEEMGGQFSMLPFQSWMTKAVSPLVIKICWPEHLIKHQGWFNDTSSSVLPWTDCHSCWDCLSSCLPSILTLRAVCFSLSWIYSFDFHLLSWNILPFLL